MFSSKKILLTTLLCLIGTLLIIIPVSAGLFDTLSSECRDLGDCTACDFIQTFINMEKYALGGLGSLALIFFIYGAIRLVLSHGNSEAISSGHNILLNTVYGILLVLLAWVIVNFIVLALTGQTNNPGYIFNSQAWYKACTSGT